MTDQPVSPDQLDQGPAPAPRHRVRAVVLAGVAGALVLGGGTYAYASGDGSSATPSGSTSASAPAEGQTPPAPPADAQKPGPHIDGTVKAVDGDTVTVTDRDGFTRTINTSSDTTYGEGLSAPLTTGTEIHATGTVNAAGTSLDATEITTAPKPGDGPAGGPGGGKGPGADGGPAALPPAGAPSGSTSGAPAAPRGAPAAPSGAPAAPSGTASDAPTPEASGS